VPGRLVVNYEMFMLAPLLNPKITGITDRRGVDAADQAQRVVRLRQCHLHAKVPLVALVLGGAVIMMMSTSPFR